MRAPLIGLCADCRYAQQIQSARGSLFYRCDRADADHAFPKYPSLPVIRCPGYEIESRGKADRSAR